MPTDRKSAFNAFDWPVSLAGTERMMIIGIAANVNAMPAPMSALATTMCHTASANTSKKTYVSAMNAVPMSMRRRAPKVRSNQPEKGESSNMMRPDGAIHSAASNMVSPNPTPPSLGISSIWGSVTFAENNENPTPNPARLANSTAGLAATRTSTSGLLVRN